MYVQKVTAVVVSIGIPRGLAPARSISLSGTVYVTPCLACLSSRTRRSPLDFVETPRGMLSLRKYWKASSPPTTSSTPYPRIGREAKRSTARKNPPSLHTSAALCAAGSSRSARSPFPRSNPTSSPTSLAYLWASPPKALRPPTCQPGHRRARGPPHRADALSFDALGPWSTGAYAGTTCVYARSLRTYASVCRTK